MPLLWGQSKHSLQSETLDHFDHPDHSDHSDHHNLFDHSDNCDHSDHLTDHIKVIIMWICRASRHRPQSPFFPFPILLSLVISTNRSFLRSHSPLLVYSRVWQICLNIQIYICVFCLYLIDYGVCVRRRSIPHNMYIHNIDIAAAVNESTCIEYIIIHTIYNIYIKYILCTIVHT